MSPSSKTKPFTTSVIASLTSSEPEPLGTQVRRCADVDVFNDVNTAVATIKTKEAVCMLSNSTSVAEVFSPPITRLPPSPREAHENLAVLEKDYEEVSAESAEEEAGEEGDDFVGMDI
ncbi:hypothetical protein HPP92_018802 [Vanilla planifolia]|uniref:Uncharacterized protein n=1 Tax=Vanilla planifolia TaxID=51239 RepID=A0A835QDK8_VANPL|nr:hypothetical protein HPP92_018802 [Vanilla planifolia]